MDISKINEILEKSPARKASKEVVAGIARLKEKRARAITFLTFKAKKTKATVAEIEAEVEKNDEVFNASMESIKAEAEFHKERDELDAVMELARNERALMRNIDPQV